jgi:hypothetical protein
MTMWGNVRAWALKASVGLAALLAASAALAQTPRSHAQLAQSSDAAQFRDPKTGTMWTPDNVGQDGKPLVGPEDRAFDPQGQAVANEGVVEQKVRAIHVGTVPITAGPNVPLIEADSTSLRVIPGGRWEFLVYLNNNSSLTLAPVLTCQFANGDKPVAVTRALVSPMLAGERVGLAIYGPQAQFFVDKASCQIATP